MALLPSHSPNLEKGLPSSEVPKAFAVGVSMDPELWGVIQVPGGMATPCASVSPSEVPNPALIPQPVSDPFLCPEPGENKGLLAGS